jgi:hypothetical protein
MMVGENKPSIRKESDMFAIPPAAEPLFNSFSVAFTEPTFQRMVVMVIGGILAHGRHTVTGMLGPVRELLAGHPSDYHRVFSRASWSLWPVGKILAATIVALLPEDASIVVAVDDTTAQHRGKKVYGKGCHHDAVRSAHKHVVYRWGHRWIVLAILIQFPFAHRRWALPVLAALYKPEALNRSEHRRHKTAVRLARQLMGVLIRWFPRRHFTLLGDGGYASHDLARFCHRLSRHVTLVSRFWPDANLYAPPPKTTGKAGRPRSKGRKLRSPKEVVARSTFTDAVVDWYGGSQRRVKLISGVGGWYKAGEGRVPVRWVFVKDVQGTHRDEYFYTTDPTLTPEQIVSLYTARWSIETTFQEMRAHLGFETPRQWVANSVLRTGPWLLGLFSVICVIFARYVRNHRLPIRQTIWYAKAEPTFSDAILTVRRLFWTKTIFTGSRYHDDFAKLPSKFRNLLLDYLCQAA